MKFLKASFIAGTGLAVGLAVSSPSMAVPHLQPEEQQVAKTLIEEFDRVSKDVTGEGLTQQSKANWNQLFRYFISAARMRIQEGECETATLSSDQDQLGFEYELCKEDGSLFVGPYGVRPQFR